MKKDIPKTRHHLLKIHRKILRTEKWVAPFVIVSGTGIRAAGRERLFEKKKRRRLRELRAEEKLVKAGLLELEKQEDQFIYTLTKNGEIQAIKDKIFLTDNRIILIILKSRLIFKRYFKPPI